MWCDAVSHPDLATFEKQLAEAKGEVNNTTDNSPAVARKRKRSEEGVEHCMFMSFFWFDSHG